MPKCTRDRDDTQLALDKVDRDPKGATDFSGAPYENKAHPTMILGKTTIPPPCQNTESYNKWRQENNALLINPGEGEEKIYRVWIFVEWLPARQIPGVLLEAQIGTPPLCSYSSW